MPGGERDVTLLSLPSGRCYSAAPSTEYDAISARIAEDLGFEIGMFAGSIASFTVLGAPDIIVLTLTEFAEQICRITRAGNLPLWSTPTTATATPSASCAPSRNSKTPASPP